MAEVDKAKVYENYYFEDSSLLFLQPPAAGYGAFVRISKSKWSGLPVTPLNFHPATHGDTEEAESMRSGEWRQYTAVALASAVGFPNYIQIPMLSVDDLDTPAS